MSAPHRDFLRLAVLFHTGLLVLTGGPLRAEAQAIRIPATRAIDLPNGLNVILAEQHSLPLIEAHIRIPAGLVAEPAGREGLATFTAEMLTQGTETRPATAIAASIDRMGATLAAAATRDDLRLSLSVMPRHRLEAFAILADCIIDPAFPDPEVERIRTRLRAALRQTAEDSDELADVALWRAVFGDDPYGRRLAGGEASIGTITAGELRDFHRTRVVPLGSVLAVVGDFDPAVMEKEITDLFGGWRAVRPAPPVSPAQPAPPGGSTVLLVHKPELEQAQIRIGYRGLERGHPDEHALTVAAAILGGGFTSRLLQAIRVERSLSYSAICQTFLDGRAGLLRVSTFTKSSTTRETVDVALDEIQKFRTDGPTSEELALNISYLSGAIARSLQAPRDIAQNLALVAFYGLPADYITERVERIRTVTIDDVRRVTSTHFAPEAMALVVVADASAVREQLAGLGPLNETGFASLIK